MSELKGRRKYRCELTNLEDLIKKLEDNDIKDMLGGLIFWYRKSAERNKWWFRASSLAVVVINAVITVMSSSDGNWQLASLSALAMVIYFATGLFHMQDNWKRYRRALELLRVEAELYICKAGVYDEADGEKRKKLLAERIAAISGDENKAWEKQRHQPKGDT